MKTHGAAVEIEYLGLVSLEWSISHGNKCQLLASVSQPQAAQLYSGTVSSDLRGGITAFAEDNIDQIDRLVCHQPLIIDTTPIKVILRGYEVFIRFLVDGIQIQRILIGIPDP